MSESCLIIAGEKSGEEHAMSFFLALKKLCPQTTFYGVGGEELKAEGLELLYHLNDFSSWGYSEIFAKIPFYKKALDDIENEVIRRKTKVAILIDFQSFNMKLAKKLKENDVKVLYYVAPQAWAWKEYRVQKLKNLVHTLFTIIPFEKNWFESRGIKRVISVDHPQLVLHQKELSNFQRSKLDKSRKLKLLILPGSRNFEVESLLYEFLEAVKILKKDIPIELGIVKSSSVQEELYRPYIDQTVQVFSNFELVEALKWADMALAASGTVTLSCALFELPTVVCYRGSLLNYFIFTTLVNYKGPISLANILHNRSVFPELIQDEVSAFKIASIIKLWYDNKHVYNQLLNELSKTKDLTRGEGIDVAQYMAKVLSETYGKN